MKSLQSISVIERIKSRRHMGLYTLTLKYRLLNGAEKLSLVMNLITVKELNKGEDRIRVF
jgi:hypothetical protein